MKNKIKYLFGGILILIVFILVSYILQINMDFFEDNLDKGIYGILIYIIIVIFATVIAPISAIPLLPVAVFLWGWFYAALFSVIAWTIGAVIAFILARKYGVNIVKKFVSMEKINYYEKFIPKKDLFIGIILVRMFLPVDLFSYLLGLFSKVDLKTYTIATFMGVIPFALVLSYIGSLSIMYQVVSFVFGGIGFLFLYYKFSKMRRIK
ncbi:MAG: VTT domain-containing protein [Nanoarchaeota archaeon]|nr:VTT domain-containing protein [Nanoarchaeota archaeon]